MPCLKPSKVLDLERQKLARNRHHRKCQALAELNKSRLLIPSLVRVFLPIATILLSTFLSRTFAFQRSSGKPSKALAAFPPQSIV